MLRRAVVAATALALLVTGTAGAADLDDQIDDAQHRRDDASRQLDDARTLLDTLSGEVDAAHAELAAADERLAAASAALVAKEAELAAAVAAHEESVARVEAATTELEALTAQLRANERHLAARQDLFSDRVAAAFKYGGNVSYTAVLLESEDVRDFLTSVKYVQTVLDRDREVVDEVTGLVRDVAADRAEAQRLRARLAHEERAAAAAAAAVQQATDEARALREEVRAERARRADALTAVQDDAAAAEAAVRELEAESRQIEAQLAELARQQRAEEERRQREAQAQSREGSGEPAAAGAPSSGWVWPANGPVTSPFGFRIHPISGSRALHEGVDIGVGYGAAIGAARDGVVVHAGWYGGYGLTVILDHGGGVATLYGHQSSLAVGDGASVGAGDTIGYVGSTGYSTGPHLHFEVRINGVPQNPLAYY